MVTEVPVHTLPVFVVTEGPVHTLEESAAAEQAKRKKVALEEVDVKTGEENEYNVFQVTHLSPAWLVGHRVLFSFIVL